MNDPATAGTGTEKNIGVHLNKRRFAILVLSCFSLALIILCSLHVAQQIRGVDTEPLSLAEVMRTHGSTQEQINALVQDRKRQLKSQLQQELFKDSLTVFALVVALFGPRLWKWIDSGAKKEAIDILLFDNLCLLYNLLRRIRYVDNTGERKPDDNVVFIETHISEITGYEYLFKDVMLVQTDVIDLKDYQKVTRFFSHYMINIQTLKSRLDKDRSKLKSKTVDRLISYLDEAICELKVNKPKPELPT